MLRCPPVELYLHSVFTLSAEITCFTGITGVFKPPEQVVFVVGSSEKLLRAGKIKTVR